MRWTGYNGVGKTLGNNVVVTFQPSDLPFPVPGRGLVKLHIRITDTTQKKNVTLATVEQIARIRVRAGGSVIYDTSAYNLTEWVSQMGGGPGLGSVAAGGTNPQAGAGGWFGARNRTSLSIPFDAFWLNDRNLGDQCQFPVNKLPSVEITCTGSMPATAIAGISWTLTDAPAVRFPTFVGQALNIPASAISGRCPISEPGDIYSLGLPTLSKTVAADVFDFTKGFTRYRIVLSGEEKFQGTPFDLFESQSYHVVTAACDTTSSGAGAISSIPLTTTLRVEGALPGAVGSSFIEADTGAFGESMTAVNGGFVGGTNGAAAANSEYYTHALYKQILEGAA